MGIFSIGASKNTKVSAPQAGPRQNTSGRFKSFKATWLIDVAKRGLKHFGSFAGDKIAELRGRREGGFNSLVEVPVSRASLTESINLVELDSSSAPVDDGSGSGLKKDESSLYFHVFSTKLSQIGDAKTSSNVADNTKLLRDFIKSLHEIYDGVKVVWDPSNDQLVYLDGEIAKLWKRFPSELNTNPTTTQEIKEKNQYSKNVSEYLVAVQELEDFVNT